METNDEEEGSAGGGGFNPEIIRSYAAYWQRALRKHWLKSALVFVAVGALTVAAFRYLPRTYTCKTVLMSEGNAILDNRGETPLGGAPSLILRHQNLREIIAEIQLDKTFKERRPALLKKKDEIVEALVGPMTPAMIKSMLVGTLESQLEVTVEGQLLTVTANWRDPVTAAQLAEAARESFVKNRHAAEIASFQDKMAILDGHSSSLRSEVEALAAQVRQLREDQLAQAKASASAALSAAARPPVPVRRRAPVASAGDQALLRQKLEIAKQKLVERETEHERKLREEQSKLSDLKLKFAPSHPEVMTAEQRVLLASQTPPEISLLRSEVKSLTEALETAGSQAGSRSGGDLGSARSAAALDALPTDIMRLLDEDNIDPAMTEQLAGAITKFGLLRNEIRSARIDLDTAQAAFKHRYKIVVPAEQPTKPSKPKPAMILGGGFAAALLLALLLPILAELRTGMIVERWQVEQFALPILAELRLPAHSSEDETGTAGPRT